MPKKPSPRLSQVAQEIHDGLQETLHFIRGKRTTGRVTLMADGQPINIRDIRAKLGMTRDEFALAFFFKRKTVQNWEQGIRRPTQHTLAYLKLIAADPRGVYKKLHAGA